jgi:UDP-N-acetylglucosamine 2-epimerase (non-hydrolysing)
LISIIFGTRPEIIKLSPVIRELEKKGIEYILIHTGQHKLDDLIIDLRLRQPDITLDLPDSSTGKFKGNMIKGIALASCWSFNTIIKIRNVIKQQKPNALLYQGDTLAIACASLASTTLRNGPKTGHVEAGLRTYNWKNPFPEEISRRIADKFSDLLFAPTKEALNNLKREKVKGKVFLTGNTIVDAVLQNLSIARRVNLDLSKNYAVVLVHRMENIHSKETMKNLIKVLESVNEDIIFLAHQSTIQKLKEFKLLDKLKNIKNLKLFPLISYLKFLKLMVGAKYVITDSGGLQEETCILKKPCIIWRKTTERPEAVKVGTAVITNCNVNTTINLIEDINNRGEFYKKVKKAKNPFGDGRAAKRIVKITFSNL